MHNVDIHYLDLYTWRRSEEHCTEWLRVLTWVGGLAVENILQHQLAKFIIDCRYSGVYVHIVTGDYIKMASSLAK